MPDYAAILNHCKNQLASTLDIAPDAITPTATFSSLGLDSAMAVHFIISVEEWLGIELYPSVTEDYPVLEDFCRFLASRAAEVS
ncbi:acyl carrier protein [Agrobacterium vitis]|nr:acyl carrier protein [Agrobacterium vitis]MBE1436557.1 acyl carrier protein [Agrobacterium vitis]